MSGQYLKKLSGLGLALGLVLGATAANAATWTVSKVGMAPNSDNSAPEKGAWGVLKTTTSDPSKSDSYKVYGDSGIGQILLTVADPKGGTFTVDSFCVDLYDALTAPATFTTDTLGSLGLSDKKNYQLSTLLNYVNDAAGANDYIGTGKLGTSTVASAGTQADRSAAVQLAIWEIVNETSDSAYDVDASDGSFGLFGAARLGGDTLTATAISDANALLTAVKSATSYSGITVAVVRAGNNQTQIIYGAGAAALLGSVPEPATWGMMILGFGAIGAALRRQRTKVSFA